MMRKLAVPIAAVLLLAGCFSTPSKQYFQLVPTDKDALPHPRIDRPLYIEPVRMNLLYDDFRIIYRVSIYQLKYYATAYWAKKPNELVRDAMADYLKHKGGFSDVTMDVPQGDPGLVLRSAVRYIEEIDNPKVWYGRLAMDLEFVDFKSGQVLVRHSFDRRLPLGARKPDFLPGVLSGILIEELDVAVGKLAAALSPK